MWVAGSDKRLDCTHLGRSCKLRRVMAPSRHGTLMLKDLMEVRYWEWCWWHAYLHTDGC